MRKEALAAVLVLASGAHLSTAAAQSATTLEDAYRDAFRMGVAINAATALGTDSATQRLVVREFNSITADNFQKAALVNPQLLDRRGLNIVHMERNRMGVRLELHAEPV